jgi:hypothetical protein
LLAGDEELSLDDIIALSQAMEQAGVSPEELIAPIGGLKAKKFLLTSRRNCAAA